MEQCITNQVLHVYVLDMGYLLYCVVITRQFNPPISKCSRLSNEFTSVWSMFTCNSILIFLLQMCKRSVYIQQLCTRVYIIDNRSAGKSIYTDPKAAYFKSTAQNILQFHNAFTILNIKGGETMIETEDENKFVTLLISSKLQQNKQRYKILKFPSMIFYCSGKL